MSESLTACTPVPVDLSPSAGDELVALGWEINANQYRAVHLAASCDDERDWYFQGLKSAAAWIAGELDIHTGTASEWIRVGHALRWLPAIDEAFARQDISYSKVRILTRWADADNEAQLLEVAQQRCANRLTTAIAALLAENGESDEERDVRLHEFRSLTTHTDGDGMTIIRIALPPSVAKPVVAAVDELVRQIAATPADEAHDDAGESSSDEGERRRVAELVTRSEPESSADDPPHPRLGQTLKTLQKRWQPEDPENWALPTVGQQRADAFAALFLRLNIDLTTEVVIHVRGDGATFDDGTPVTNSAVLRRLDHSYLRAMIHDENRRPIDASNRRRHPTTRQKRVVMEGHNHECVECQSTHLIELDHNPPFERTGHTVTSELEPRCAPCHRARHRMEHLAQPATA